MTGLRAAVRGVVVPRRRRQATPVLTVAMPVYDVADYLRECLDSVLGQDLGGLGELEVIAVDDSSTDGSLAILRDYERRDHRVRVLTQPNAGQGPARNNAVAHARGEFLTFVDSDDTVPPGALAAMVERLRESGSDFAIGGVRRMRRSGFVRMGWARTVFSRDRTGTNLAAFPAAMQDVVTHHRVFRTSFWRDRCPEFRGIAYEDHVPMLMAYVRAERFDVMSRVVYDWRIREERSSTSQQKASLPNLRDRITVLEEAHGLLLAEASADVYDLWVARVLDVDLPPFLKHAVGGADDYREVLQQAFATYLERATPEAEHLVTARQKIRAHLAAAGRWDDLLDADAWFEDVGLMPPAHAVDGRVTALPQPSLAFLDGLPRHVGDLAPIECHPQVVLDRVARDGSSLTLTGWAVTRGLGVTGPTQLSALLVGADGSTVEVPVVPARLPEAGSWGKQRYADYADGGFVVTVDTSSLAPGTWHVEVETTYSGITSAGPVVERVADADLGGLAWDPSYGLTIGVPLGPPVAPAPERPPGAGLGAQARRALRDRVLDDRRRLADTVLVVGDVDLPGVDVVRVGDDPEALFTAVASSRWVVTDEPLGDDLAWWAPREGQHHVLVLTTPPSGATRWRAELTNEGVALELLRVRRTWDVVAVAEPGWEAAVRTEYGFDGTVVALSDVPALIARGDPA
ncbi:MAG: CDP-glycerol:glycerophosphate glycerophosphotransferase [Nocardioidaceae bacterium]|nr:CDP-glycerol:glycerophosphate glycerophosphotransferase [Nocardioidaceae bacterium]